MYRRYMTFKYKIVLIFAILIASFVSASSQSGMTFNELDQRLSNYYADALINDIRLQLPQGSSYRIWGWDVGDFSGDGFNDVAVSIKLAQDRKKNIQVYMFTDIDGYLTKVGQFNYKYVELPLEIGVVIRDNACFVTKKNKQFDWLIRGYRYQNGTLFLYDEYFTRRIKNMTYEKHVNYQNMRNSEKYITTFKGNVKFFADFLSIPCYNRGRTVYEGYPRQTEVDYVDFVNKGAYYWNGRKDASFSVSSAFDEKYIYMTVNVRDDIHTIQYCDTCPADFMEVWLDVNPPEYENDRFVTHNIDKVKFRDKVTKGIFSFRVYPGDFREEVAYVKEVATTDRLYNFQKKSATSIRAISNLTDDGYVLKFKIPFIMFGYDTPPVDPDNFTEFGCTVVFHDIDNEFRAEEETQVASSLFDATDPATYGSLLFIPNGAWYGKMENIYVDEIEKTLTEMGF
jgi:hypothetical protein